MIILEAFWIILEDTWVILEAFWIILEVFWILLEPKTLNVKNLKFWASKRAELKFSASPGAETHIFVNAYQKRTTSNWPFGPRTKSVFRLLNIPTYWGTLYSVMDKYKSCRY